jgi:two-component system cell cycle response regulator
MCHSCDHAPEPASSQGHEVSPPALERSGLRPSKILVVDDEEAVRKLIVDILHLDGYEVSEAGDGVGALQLLAREPFDVVLTDLVMPRMDGLTLLKTARQYRYRAAYIVMTAYASWDSAVEALKSGAEDYLPKPCHLELLRLVVARVLGKRRLEERAKQAELYEKLAHTDGLTGLYNYRFFHQLLSVEMSRAQRFHRPLSLIMLDLDHFKAYNDVYGHPAGDHALRQLARLLRRSSRSYDLVARYGGDEFVIILPETGKGTAAEVAERIRIFAGDLRVRRDDVRPGGRITVSLGVASFPEDATETGDLIRKADRALYQAKARGRNRIYPYDSRA